ncbi:MAG: DUF4388 domain-containing protein [Candidatus Obscuribacterales bacterium]|nr:DUF4388 domain-containing protein [Candidatus Obscuribacterales bacterium]
MPDEEETKSESEEVITENLTDMMSQDSVIVLKYSANLTSELEELVQSKQLFDAVLIDCKDGGFLFPTEMIVDAGRLANNFLEVQGALIFINTDRALALVREHLAGALAFISFENHSELFDYSPPLAKHVQAVLGKGNLIEESSDLARQVLLGTVPVLTATGIKMKAGMDAPRRRNAAIAAIDNYTPIGTISQRLSTSGKMDHEELLEELRGLEQVKAIYPLFNKATFLVNCFRNKTPFTLKDYLVAGKLVTESQLDEMLFELQSTNIKDRITLGPLTVKKGFISTRQLEIAMQDQAFYGQSTETKQKKIIKTSGEETQVQSMVGHLGTTDPSNLLQNLATNRETGVLSVEHRDQQFRACFEVGKLTHAKVGKLQGNKAVSEFACAWREGIFVFMQRTPPSDLMLEPSKLTKPLDKLLLDSALAKDNTDVVAKKLSKGFYSVLEKVTDTAGKMSSGDLIDPQEKKPLKPSEIELMKRVHSHLDGLTSLNNVLRYLGDITTPEFARTIDLLLHYKLVSTPDTDLMTPLSKFQELIGSISEKIGGELSVALLRLGLRDAMANSGRAHIFAMNNKGDIGVDMVGARQTNASLSSVIQDLENWQVKYIEYVSQEVDRDVLLSLITQIHS